MSMYRTAYASLGEERIQKVEANMSTTVGKNGEKETDAQSRKVFVLSEQDTFWLLRRDRNWMEIPGKFKIVRRTRERIFLEGISQILQQLEPMSYFNPVDLWKNEKLAEAAKAEEAANVEEAPGKDKGKKGGKPDKKEKAKKPEKLSAKDKIIMENNVRKQREALESEVTLIRNSKKNLLPLIRKLKFNDSRFILLCQLLKSAVSEYQQLGNKRAMYEVLWAIDDLTKVASFPVLPAPKCSDPKLLFEKDPSLVFDDLKRVEALLREARDVMTNESDIIRMQLTEMSDCLPPLSKLNFGFQLDEWQKQALRWIDNNESVVICAPTSSGKTVLSAYVAVIFKANLNKPDEAVSEQEKKKAAPKAITNGKDKKDDKAKNAARFGDEDEEEFIDEEEEEEMGLDLAVELTEEEELAYSTGAKMLEEQVAALSLAEGDDMDNLVRLVEVDRIKREDFRNKKKTLPSDFEFMSNSGQKVLFVVPKEPLVWQVAAYFTKMLREEGDRATRVAVVTDALIFSPAKKLGVMPQIVVGTPFALESALSRPYGLNGRYETSKKAAGDKLAGGFDHFDWAIYDEVHALDGDEGAALQRLIRSMHCPFLALSATVGNAEQLKGWMQSMRADQHATTIHALTVKEGVETDTTPATTVALSEEQQKEQDKKENVNLLVRQVRFINLQRYIWSTEAEDKPEAPESAADGAEEEAAPEKLRLVSPLAAVPSVQALRDGILSNSSLSFTSSDAYTLWLQLKHRFPKEAVARLDPRNFFDKTVRITLARTKEYEDVIKQGLRELAASHPAETQALLDHFRVDAASKELDLCDLMLTLKAKNMLPAVAFHLNTFDAIKLYQQVLAGLEHRQKLAHPTYYNKMTESNEALRNKINKIKESCGGNEELIRQKMQQGEIVDVGSVDTSAPHPDFMMSKSMPMVDHELDRLLFDMERNDGFEKRDSSGKRNDRNEVILRHALIRGLRRGIGLFIDEVSFPSYRRAVQKLASTGKLGLVISDNSLAFGVNMPFRTCVFCGEMRGELDELMAQQMSGRAGRRGLDAQGNIVYAGIRPSTMSRLMIGTVANITGEHQNPRYESVILQPILSPRYSGFYRSLVLSGTTLNEFCAGTKALAMDNLRASMRLMTQLRFIKENEQTHALVPDDEAGSNYALLCLIWELRHYPHESFTIGMLIDQLIAEFDAFVRTLNLRDRGRNQELMDSKLNDFFSILVQLVCRTPWKPSTDPRIPDPPKLHELPYFTNDATGSRLNLLRKWETFFASQQADIPEEFAHLRDPTVPGTALDGTFFQCAIDRKFVFTLDEVKKQEVKHQLWHVGTVLKTMNNALNLDDAYVYVSYFVFRDAFEKLRYLNSELIHDIVNFSDVSSFEAERRADTAADVQKPVESELWTDLDTASFAVAMTNVLQTATQQSLSTSLLSADKLIRTGAEDKVHDLIFIYTHLHRGDAALVRSLLTWNMRDPAHAEKIAKALSTTSFVAPAAPAKMSAESKVLFSLLGVTCWIALVVKPEPRFLPFFARELADLNTIEGFSKQMVSEFIALSDEQMLLFVPSSYSLNGTVVAASANPLTADKLKIIREQLQKYVELVEESDDDEEDDEEDEEEDEE